MVTENDFDDMLSYVFREVIEELLKENLAEIERRTEISRQRLRKWQKDEYKAI